MQDARSTLQRRSVRSARLVGSAARGPRHRRASHGRRRGADGGGRVLARVGELVAGQEGPLDRLRQAVFREALQRFSVPPALRDPMMNLYSDPQSMVELEHTPSTWHMQDRGIRPLSPYLFLVAMTALFRDLEADAGLPGPADRIVEGGPAEVLYADDTILMTNSTRILHKYLWAKKNTRRGTGSDLTTKNVPSSL